MDLSTLQTKQTSVLDLIGPNKEPTNISITLYSADSDVYDSAVAQMRDELVKLPSKASYTSPEQRRDIIAAMYARCTKEWEGLSWKGKELECTFENAKMIYAQPGLKWILDQVQAFMEKRSNFLDKSSGS